MRTATAKIIVGLFVAGLLVGCSSSEERATEHFERGKELLADGESVKASLEFRNALQLKEGYPEAAFALAEVEEGQGHLDGAARLYASVAEQWPKDVKSRLRLTYILLTAGQTEDASKFVEEALAISPSDPNALVMKATIALKRDNRGDAIRIASSVLEKDGTNVDALMVMASERMLADEPAQALEFIKRVAGDDQVSVPVQLMRLSAFEKLGDDAAVEGVLRELVELQPEDVAFQNPLVHWLLNKGRVDDAEQIVRRFADAHADNAEAQLRLVSFLKSERGAEETAKQLERLIAAGGDVFKYQLMLAEIQFEAGERPEAVRLLRELVESTAEGANRNRARVQLARAMSEMEDPVEAQRLIDEVIALDPKNVDALGARASLRLAGGHPEESITDLIAALNEAPESLPLLSLLGDAYERSGKVELAEEQYVKLVQAAGPNATVALKFADFLLRYGKMQQAERLLEDSLARTGEDDPRILELLAQLKLGRQDWIGAEEVADRLRSGAHGESADSIAAAALNGAGRFDESIALLQTSANDGGQSADQLPVLVTSYMQSGKPELAEAALLAAIERDPEDIQAPVLLGVVYLQQDKQGPAKAIFEDLIAKHPEIPTGYVALGKFYLATGDLSNAEKSVRAGLGKYPENATLQLMLGSLLEQKQDFDGAIAVYEQVLASDPGSTVAANNVASLLSEYRSDPKSLERAFEIAARFRTSEVPHFLDTLGWIYHLRGDDPAAISLLKVASDRLPEIGAVQFHLGMTLKSLDQTELAVASLEKSLELVGATEPAYAPVARTALEQLRATKPVTASN